MNHEARIATEKRIIHFAAETLLKARFTLVVVVENFQ